MLCRPYASVSAKQTRHFQAMGQCIKEMRQQNSLMYHMKLKNLCRFSGSGFLGSWPHCIPGKSTGVGCHCLLQARLDHCLFYFNSNSLFDSRNFSGILLLDVPMLDT